MHLGPTSGHQVSARLLRVICLFLFRDMHNVFTDPLPGIFVAPVGDDISKVCHLADFNFDRYKVSIYSRASVFLKSTYNASYCYIYHTITCILILYGDGGNINAQ